MNPLILHSSSCLSAQATYLLFLSVLLAGASESTNCAISIMLDAGDDVDTTELPRRFVPDAAIAPNILSRSVLRCPQIWYARTLKVVFSSF